MEQEQIKEMVNYYGANDRVRLLMEECGELVQAGNKILRYTGSQKARDNLLEEMVDVSIMIAQICVLFNYSNSEWDNMMQYKFNRCKKRFMEDIGALIDDEESRGNKMRTLDEAIRGEEAVADACEKQANMCDLDDPYARNVAYENGKCAEMHKQIAEWLKELKRLREQDANAILDNIKEEIESEYGNYDICEFDEDYDYEENNISEYTFVGSVVEILEIIDKYKVETRVDNLPSVRPVSCIATVTFNKEDMQKIVDDAVKELVLENAR